MTHRAELLVTVPVKIAELTAFFPQLSFPDVPDPLDFALDDFPLDFEALIFSENWFFPMNLPQAFSEKRRVLEQWAQLLAIFGQHRVPQHFSESPNPFLAPDK